MHAVHGIGRIWYVHAKERITLRETKAQQPTGAVQRIHHVDRAQKERLRSASTAPTGGHEVHGTISSWPLFKRQGCEASGVRARCRNSCAGTRNRSKYGPRRKPGICLRGVRAPNANVRTVHGINSSPASSQKEPMSPSE